MKNSLLFYFLLLPFIGFGQADYEHVFIQNRHSNLADITLLNQKIIAVGSIGDCSRTSVWMMDEDGDLIWQKSPIFGYSKLRDVLLTTNNFILASGYRTDSDDFPSLIDGFAVTKLDTLGNIVFTTQLRYGDFLQAISIKNNPLLVLDTSTFWMGGANKIFHLNLQNGDSLATIDYPVNEFVALHKQGDEIKALSKRKLLTLSITGDIQNETIFYEDLIDLKIENDITFIAGTNQVFRIENNVIDSLQFNQLQKITRMAQDTDGNWLIWGTTVDTEQMMVIKFNHDLLPLENYTFTDTRKHFTHIVPTNEAYFIAGFDNLEDVSPLYISFHKDFVMRKSNLMDDEFPAFHDIGMVNLTSETEVIVESTDTFGTTIVYNLENNVLDFLVTVQNFGDTPIDIFGYASEFNGGFNCADGRFIDKNEELLMPGEQALLTATLFINPSVTATELEYCFFTFAPNEKFDQVFENNSICTTVLLTSDNEQPLSKNKIKIFPNPANDVLHLSAENDLIQNWELTDISGQKILVQKDINAIKTEIQRGDLPAGIYFLKIETTEGQKVEKVIFE